MKIIMPAAALTVIAFVSGCTGQDYVKRGFDFAGLDKVAVLDVRGDIETEAAKNQVAGLFEAELAKKGYTPVKRAQAHALLKEHEFPISELDGTVGAVRAGLTLDVPAVLVVTIPNLGDKVSIAAKMTDVEAGGVLWRAAERGRAGRTLKEIADIVRAKIGKLPPPDITENIVEGELSSQKIDLLRRMTAKMFKTLPARVKRSRGIRLFRMWRRSEKNKG